MVQKQEMKKGGTCSKSQLQEIKVKKIFIIKKNKIKNFTLQKFLIGVGKSSILLQYTKQ